MSKQWCLRSSVYWTFIMTLVALMAFSSLAYAGNNGHHKKRNKNRCKNALFLIDNTRKGDGFSIVYRVKPNLRRSKAHLREFARLPYDRAHIAMGPKCRRLYAIQNGNVRLGYYDMVDKSFVDVGPLPLRAIVQAAFNRAGQLYVASMNTNKVYIIDQDESVTPTALTVHEIGKVKAPDSTTVDLNGADLVFPGDGSLYVMTRKHGNLIYEIPDEVAGLSSSRVFDGPGTQSTGLAFLPKNNRYLVYSSRDLDQIVVIDRLTGNVVNRLDMMLDGQAFDAGNGDMTVSMSKCHRRPRPRCEAPEEPPGEEPPGEEPPGEEPPGEEPPGEEPPGEEPPGEEPPGEEPPGEEPPASEG
ncbi:MAG: hypothetical protein ETSY1_25010 [Candidatus Entotheonella factor]|uniref:SMP-30/Gluconolactonase/LRE-like region domain-containing protein n=1 Tax=Entotheonella factor TaxID=1429438 RepID=W4LFT6_ENTF1|nr:hypothetical protein [Candidatus Entotheonella palauensis]ETW96842.1 MAG: hypothetical protein ETSY1_25010 [Candidatus Entotheonella factor]